MWHIGLALLAVLVLVIGAATLVIVLVGGLFGVVGLSANAGLGALVVLVLGVASIAGIGRRIGRAAAPLGDLIEAAGRVEAGERGVRVVERGPGEVRSLGRAFNAMSGRLAADEAFRRSLLADISHELRTPMTVIQGTVEGILDGVYPADDAHLAPIADATRTLARLIDDLGTLALADRGALDLHREPVDLATLASETAAGLDQVTSDAPRIVVDAPDHLPLVDADPVRIREVLANLIANAIGHGAPDGRVTIALRAGPGEPRTVSVAVSDDGSGIDPALLPHVFDRFVKSPHSPGTGLGLAIARDLVSAHGGTIDASSPPGGGTTIRFVLPVAGSAR